MLTPLISTAVLLQVEALRCTLALARTPYGVAVGEGLRVTLDKKVTAALAVRISLAQKVEVGADSPVVEIARLMVKRTHFNLEAAAEGVILAAVEALLMTAAMVRVAALLWTRVGWSMRHLISLSVVVALF